MFKRARLRLALWYAAVFTVILVALGASAYLVMARELDAEIDDSLESALAGAERFPQEFLRGEPRSPRGAGNPPGGGPQGPDAVSTDVFVFSIASDRTIRNNPRNLDIANFPLASIQDEAADGQAWTDFRSGGEHYRVTASAVRAFDEEVTLVVGRSLDARDYQLRLLATVLAVGGVIGLAAASMAGWLLAGRSLSPIRSAMDTQRRFVSDASHELRTPVAVMKANAELLLRHPDQTVEANIDQVAAINEEADHLTRLVADLLLLARADEQVLSVEREKVAVDEILETLVRDMEAIAESKGIVLKRELAHGEVQADPQRLRQLLAILLDNALKFTPAGGTVTVRSRRQGSRWALSVSDTGPGIPEDAQGRVFDRFFRVDEARSGQAGTGLGLSIARWIAEAHHGRIAVTSAPGEGATFTVTLPES